MFIYQNIHTFLVQLKNVMKTCKEFFKETFTCLSGKRYIYLYSYKTLIHCPNMVIKLLMYKESHDVHPTTDVSFAF